MSCADHNVSISAAIPAETVRIIVDRAFLSFFSHSSQADLCALLSTAPDADWCAPGCSAPAYSPAGRIVARSTGEAVSYSLRNGSRSLPSRTPLDERVCAGESWDLSERGYVLVRHGEKMLDMSDGNGRQFMKLDE